MDKIYLKKFLPICIFVIGLLLVSRFVFNFGDTLLLSSSIILSLLGSAMYIHITRSQRAEDRASH